MSNITHLQKTAVNINPDKVNAEKLAKNAPSKASPTQAAKTSAPLPSVARSASSLAAAAGLPQDKLSSAIVSFARFFSLPLKPQTLSAIRRQAFTPPNSTPQLPQSVSANPAEVKDTSVTLAAKMREALSLSAAAADSKGVELSPKGLETYAEAVDPEWQRRQNGGERQRKRQNKNKEQAEEKAPLKTVPITASALEKTALDSADKEPLLAILNRLPGKNGQRWIVLPFDFSEDKRDFRVSMRILLEDKTASAVCMALDIAESPVSENGETGRRWLFMLESANDKQVRLSVYIQPELPQKAQGRLKDELSALLEISPERVFVKNSELSFPCEEGRADKTASIDEAV